MGLGSSRSCAMLTDAMISLLNMVGGKEKKAGRQVSNRIIN